MRITNKELRKRIRKILLREAMYEDPNNPTSEDFFAALRAKGSLPHIDTDTNTLLLLRGGDLTVSEKFQKMHDITKYEMRDVGWYADFADDVAADLRYTDANTSTLNIPNNTMSGYLSKLNFAPTPSTPTPTSWTTLLSIPKSYGGAHEQPPGAITDFSYAQLNTVANGSLGPHELAMSVYIETLNNRTDVYNAIENSKEVQFSDDQQVEVAFAGFLAATPGATNVTHTANAPGIDSMATIEGVPYMFELKKGEGGAPNRSYNTTPVYSDNTKFYVFINPQFAYIVRSDVLAIFERLVLPLAKDEIGAPGTQQNPGFAELQLDAEILAPSRALLIDSIGNNIPELINSMGRNKELVRLLDKHLTSSVVGNLAGLQIGLWESNPNAQNVLNSVGFRAFMRSLVINIGVPRTMLELTGKFPSSDPLTAHEVRDIASRVNMTAGIRAESATSNRLQTFLVTSVGRPFASDSEDIQNFAYAYYSIINNFPHGSSQTGRRAMMGLQLRVGQPRMHIGTTGASQAEVDIGNISSLVDPTLIDRLTNPNISNLEKAQIIRMILQPSETRGRGRMGSQSYYQMLNENLQQQVVGHILKLLYDELKLVGSGSQPIVQMFQNAISAENLFQKRKAKLAEFVLNLFDGVYDAGIDTIITVDEIADLKDKMATLMTLPRKFAYPEERQPPMDIPARGRAIDTDTGGIRGKDTGGIIGKDTGGIRGTDTGGIRGKDTGGMSGVDTGRRRAEFGTDAGTERGMRGTDTGGMRGVDTGRRRAEFGIDAGTERGMRATGRRGLYESELYERILKKILYTAKKRR